MSKDIASPIDLRNMTDAVDWQNSANLKRPWRKDFFDFYVNEISTKLSENAHILELGSGPGFFAKHLLSHLTKINYTAFDFSQAMHDLSKQKLSISELQRAKYIIGDFKQQDWTQNLGTFDCIIIHQALHELRHKDYAATFHRQIKTLMTDNSIYFVCDHLYAVGAMQNHQLYMSKQEHSMALATAGYQSINMLLEINGLCLFEVQL